MSAILEVDTDHVGHVIATASAELPDGGRAGWLVCVECGEVTGPAVLCPAQTKAGRLCRAAVRTDLGYTTCRMHRRAPVAPLDVPAGDAAANLTSAVERVYRVIEACGNPSIMDLSDCLGMPAHAVRVCTGRLERRGRIMRYPDGSPRFHVASPMWPEDG